MKPLVIPEKTEKLFLSGCLALLLFMFCDTHFFPKEANQEFVTRVIAIEHRSHNATFYTYRIQTDRRSFEVYSDLYYTIKKDDTVIIKLSRLTKSLISIAVRRLSYQEFKNGYITTFKGIVFLPILFVAITLTFLLFDRFPYAPGRQNLVIMIMVLTIIQVYYYFNTWQHLK